MRNNFLGKLNTKCGGDAILRPFSKKSIFTILKELSLKQTKQIFFVRWESDLNVALAVPKIFKWLNLPPFARHFAEIKPDVNGVDSKGGHVHPINSCGWSSKIFHACLSFAGNVFYICLKMYYSVDLFYHGFLKNILIMVNIEELSK